MKINIHKRKRKEVAHEVTVKDISYEAFSLLLTFAKEGMQSYINQTHPNEKETVFIQDLIAKVKVIKDFEQSIEDQVQFVQADISGLYELEL